jgi:hypothetical protein
LARLPDGVETVSLETEPTDRSGPDAEGYP